MPPTLKNNQIPSNQEQPTLNYLESLPKPIDYKKHVVELSESLGSKEFSIRAAATENICSLVLPFIKEHSAVQDFDKYINTEIAKLNPATDLERIKRLETVKEIIPFIFVNHVSKELDQLIPVSALEPNSNFIPIPNNFPGRGFLLMRVTEDLRTNKDISDLVEAVKEKPELMGMLTELLISLKDENDDYLAVALASQQVIPQDLQDLIIQDSNSHVRMFLAQNDNISLESKRKLLNDKNLDVSTAIFSKNDSADDLFPDILQCIHVNARITYAQRLDLTPEQYEELAAKGEPVVLRALGANVLIPDSVMLTIVNSKYLIAISDLAANPSLSKEAAGKILDLMEEKLAEDLTSPELFEALACNPVLDEVTVERLVKIGLKENQPPRTNTYFPEMEVICQNEKASSVFLEFMSNSNISEVRAQVARNTATPTTLLQKMLTDESELVRASIVLNPSSTAEMREQLFTAAKASEVMLSRALVCIKDVDSKHFETLSLHPNPQVRLDIAEHPLTPLEIRKKLQNDNIWYIKVRAHLKPLTENQIIEKSAQLFRAKIELDGK
ncbi:MAG: hypothetical protein KBC84_08645 [Proteobacteria bacterium]|nr:hypothetical protein [Pseudomonadota bacterium]